MNKYYLSILVLTGALTAGAVVPGTPVIVPNPQKAQSESLVPMRPMKSALEKSVLRSRMTTDGLAPGVYVVRSTSGVSKVVVR